MNWQNNDPNFHHVTDYFSEGSFSILCQKVSKLYFTENKFCFFSISVVPIISMVKAQTHAKASRAILSAYSLDNTVGIWDLYASIV